MKLISAVQSLQTEPLTAQQVESLSKLQTEFAISDDDPILVVLAVMAKSQLVLDNAPGLLQQKVDATIELHRVALREQAVAISKELITDFGQRMYTLSASTTKRLWMYLLFYTCGAASAGAVFALVRFLSSR